MIAEHITITVLAIEEKRAKMAIDASAGVITRCEVTLQEGFSLLINGVITLKAIEVLTFCIGLGITAPREINIVRVELL
jgi:sRNA-binding carbon storage regulator CsrA